MAEPVMVGGRVVATGRTASRGVAEGVVSLVRSYQEAERAVCVREDIIFVLVGPTTPEWLPAMRRARGFVTTVGGVLCHTALVARELGVPCIVGARFAEGEVTYRLAGRRVRLEATGREGALVLVGGD
jgi:pyruvate,water dikinase